MTNLSEQIIKDLIEKAEGVTPEAFMSRGLLVRVFDDSNKENIAFSISAILNGTTSITLKARDEIRIFNKQDLREKRTFSIGGAINNPAEFNFIEKLQIEDVIAMSGGLKEGADPQVIHVSRRLKDGSFEKLSKNFTISSETNLKINEGKPFYIEPFDIITVRYLKGYTPQKNVVVKGEVKYQGSYVITNKNERISDLVKRAGGLTPFAYLKGATLIGNGPDAMSKISMIGNDLALDDGIGTCGKDGQGVPVGVGQPTLLMGGITIGGTDTN